jgi:predicted O-methyltransferase YrrM
MNADSLPLVLRTALAERQVFNPDGQKVPLGSNISPEEALDLYRAVRDLKPEVSLEVGFAHGVSALAILQALEDNQRGHHHVMDPFQGNYGRCGLAMVGRAGLAPRMTFHEKFAEEVIPSLAGVDFAFIDSSHLFDLTVCEFVLVDKKLRVGGVVGFHDMWMPAQQAFIRYLLANRAYEIYHPPASPRARAGRDHPLKRSLRRAAAMLPRAEQVFAPDFLKPWGEFALGNLVLVRKRKHDDRDWTWHRRF